MALVELEKALVLITLKMKTSSNLVSQIINVDGVSDASLVHGYYDAYAVVETDTKENLRNAVFQIRQLFGVHSTITCNVIP